MHQGADLWRGCHHRHGVGRRADYIHPWRGHTADFIFGCRCDHGRRVTVPGAAAAAAQASPIKQHSYLDAGGGAGEQRAVHIP